MQQINCSLLLLILLMQMGQYQLVREAVSEEQLQQLQQQLHHKELELTDLRKRYRDLEVLVVRNLDPWDQAICDPLMNPALSCQSCICFPYRYVQVHIMLSLVIWN